MVESIWRYPLKSAQGEAVPRVFIGADGPAGDRAWACISADGMIVSAKHPRRWGRMLYVLAVLMTAGAGAGDEEITTVSGAAPGGRFVDFGAVHLVTTSALAELESDGAPVDVRRLRPNLVLALDREPAPGDRIRVGPEVALRVLVPTPRCALPGAVQPGLASAPGLLRAIGRRRVEIPGLGRAACFGSYAQVLAPGTVTAGDPADVSS
jgi:uncharacterized protein